MMYAVCATFQIVPGQMDEFMPLMLVNARASLNTEPGCHRFDVLTDPDRPGEVFLYELYSDAAAFDDHLASKHFKIFDAAVSDMIASKTVKTYAEVAS